MSELFSERVMLSKTFKAATVGRPGMGHNGRRASRRSTSVTSVGVTANNNVLMARNGSGTSGMHWKFPSVNSMMQLRVPSVV